MAPKKIFDCVDMKHRGAAKVQPQLAGMTREQQLEYWRTRTDGLLDLQRREKLSRALKRSDEKFDKTYKNLAG